MSKTLGAPEAPLVTVVIPSYNVEAYYAECLQSLLDQTYANFEALCIDDGSTDNTVAVGKRTVGDDPRFVFVEQKNAGQSAARNVALDRARGVYVLHLDSDDYYTPDALELLVAKAQNEELDLLCFSASTFYETRELNRTHPENQDDRRDIEGVMDGCHLFAAFERVDSFRPSACLFMYRREMIEDAGLRFEEGIIHEDLLFTMQVFPLAQRAAFLNRVLYKRRMRAGSTMTSARSIKNVQGLFTVAEKLETWFDAHQDELSQEYCDAFCHRLFDTWETVARDVPVVGEEKIKEFRDTLSPAQRRSFNLHVYELGKCLDRVYSSIHESKTFKVGHAIMAFPVWLKSRFVLPK